MWPKNGMDVAANRHLDALAWYWFSSRVWKTELLGSVFINVVESDSLLNLENHSKKTKDEFSFFVNISGCHSDLVVSRLGDRFWRRFWERVIRRVIRLYCGIWGNRRDMVAWVKARRLADSGSVYILWVLPTIDLDWNSASGDSRVKGKGGLGDGGAGNSGVDFWGGSNGVLGTVNIGSGVKIGWCYGPGGW
ncbi:hypothetical protein Tco_1191272 [Tanacetum coccineum]